MLVACSQVDSTAVARRSTRLAVEATAKALAARIEPLEQTRYEQAGRRGLSAPLLMLLAGLGGGIVVYFVEHLATVAPVVVK